MRFREFKRKFPEKIEVDADFIERTLKSYLDGTCFKNMKNYINYLVEEKNHTKKEEEQSNV